LGLDGARVVHRRVSVSGAVASQAIAGVQVGVGSERAPHAPLGEQRAWAIGDPDATAGAAASQAGPVKARRFSGQAAARVVFALGEACGGSGRLDSHRGGIS